MIANQGYILGWLWHAKGDGEGPVDLNKYWIKEEGFLKVQAVVLNLLIQENKNGQRLYPLK